MGRILYHGSDHIIEQPEYGLALLAENRTYWQNGSIAQEAKQYIKEHFLIDSERACTVIRRCTKADTAFGGKAQGYQ